MDDNKDKSAKEYAFIKETIGQKKKANFLGRFIIILAALLIIGSCIVVFFFFDDTLLNIINYSEKETESNTGEVVETGNEVSTYSVDEMVENALLEYQKGVTDYKSLSAKLKKTTQIAEKYMVTVAVCKDENDWLNGTGENDIITSGIVISKSHGLLVLTDYDTIKEGQIVAVYLDDGVKRIASVKQKSELAGLAVISMDLSSVPEDIVNEISVAEYDVDINEGSPIIYMGNPVNEKLEMSYGTLTTKVEHVCMPDSTMTLLSTDIMKKTMQNGFIINMDGKVVGMTLKSKIDDGVSKTVSALNIKDLGIYIEELARGRDVPYIGINGTEVTQEIIYSNDDNMPYGIYITSTEAGSPAYNAGIMNGDILVKIMDNDVTTMEDYMTELNNLSTQQEITVTVMRKGKNDYKKLEYKIILGSR